MVFTQKLCGFQLCRGGGGFLYVTGVLHMDVAVTFLLFRVKEILLLYGIELEIAIETGAKGANLTNDSEFTKSGRPIK